MRMILTLIAALLPAPAMAAELWCMPDTLCNAKGKCHATTDEESSIRLHNLAAKKTTMRSHAETIPMKRQKAGSALEWRGTNESGGREYVIWSKTSNAFTYTVSATDGAVWKSSGVCEVQ
ncbi:hypothetical protein GCM10010873_27710 [Cypionkella aquatica]|uniref:C-type lysozyme inhibitor domain-containing protein n=2 Tax=Cypionkella aquatica TaxID=1756042 RepID=A0AA37X126_9RHOB|nr:hypothetical protein GCM10010873_27710 [Cypionkella aquatica]